MCFGPHILQVPSLSPMQLQKLYAAVHVRWLQWWKRVKDSFLRMNFIVQMSLDFILIYLQ